VYVDICPGISQLPALLSLQQLHNADVNLCNVDGMTPLMLAASFGDSILVNVSFIGSVFAFYIEAEYTMCLRKK